MGITIFGDRLQQPSLTTGVGPFTLQAPQASFFAISSVFGVGVQFPVGIEGLDGSGNRNGQAETGVAHLDGSGHVVIDSIDKSTNANAAVNFTAASLRIYVSLNARALEEWRTPAPDLFTATGGQTVFTLTRAPRSQASTKMFVNGTQQTPGTDFTVVGTTLTWLNTDFAMVAGYKVAVEY